MNSGFALSGVFFLIWLIIVIGSIVGFVFLVIAAWRAMKAHESIADSFALYVDREQRRQ